MSEIEIQINSNDSEKKEAPRGFRSIIKNLRSRIIDDDALWTNEIKANHLVATTMLFMAVALCICLALAALGYFSSQLLKNIIPAVIAIAELFAGTILCNIFKGRRKWLKYILMVLLCSAICIFNAIWTFRSTLALVIPIILSARYFSKKLTFSVAALMSVTMLLSCVLGFMFPTVLDLNYLNIPRGQEIIIYESFQDTLNSLGYSVQDYMMNVLTHYYLPTFLIFGLLTIISSELAVRGKIAVQNQAEISREQAKMDTELSLATEIQAHTLPRVFPPFPERTEFDLNACTYPAKRVGGDFYDYFRVNDDEYAICMADASGKGVPAALIMMLTKTLIKNYAQMGMSPVEVFSRVNDSFLEGNDDGHFVTAWLGYLNIHTGVIRFVNAGHNPPIYSTDGKYSYLSMKPGLVLGGMPGFEYHEEQITLKEGSRLFLYTDGVTEDISESDEQFGEDRLLAFVEKHDQSDRTKLLDELKLELDNFAIGCKQMDDETMLVLDVLKLTPAKEKSDKEVVLLDIPTPESRDEDDTSYEDWLKVPAISSRLDEVKEFILQKAQMSFSNNAYGKIELSIEEIYINIASYAYPDKMGYAKVRAIRDEEAGELRIYFEDGGVPFNPLQAPAPEDDEEQIGGLGIYFVIKSMDDVQYKYQDGKNCLCLVKKFDCNL